MLSKRIARTLKEVLKFELCYKLVVLCLVNPLFHEIYQTYVSSRGVSFNENILGTFLQVKGILIFLALFFGALVVVFYELSVMVNIITLCRQDKEFTLKQVLKCSVWNFRALKGISIIPSSLYFILLLPLVCVGYVNTIVPRIEIPWFIFGELQKTELGRIGMMGIHAAYFGLYFFMIFVPLFMVLKQQTLGKALKSSVGCFRKLGWKYRIMIPAGVIVWAVLHRVLYLQYRRNFLENQDFDFYFFKYLLQSEAFRIDFLFWLLFTLVLLVLMVLFLYVLISLVMKTEQVEVALHPQWKGDTKVVLSIANKHATQWLKRQKVRLKQKRYWALGGLLLGALGLFLVFGVHQVPLLHQPLTIGHRGCVYGIENSVDAVQKAGALGVDYAEIDVQLSKDGVPVVVHDSNLQRLTGKSVDVRSLTVEELQKLDIRTDVLPGETAKISTLEEMIRTVKNTSGSPGLLIELKSSEGEGEELANAVMNLVEQYDFGQQAMLMSLAYGDIQPILEKHPEWWIGYCIYGSSGELDDSIWKYNIDFLAVEESQVSNRLVAQARAHWIPIYVWTVSDTEKMKQYLEMGVTGLVGDVPDDIKPVIEEYNRKNGTAQYYWQGQGYPKGVQFD